MNPLEIPGDTVGTALHFAPAGDGRLAMAVLHRNAVGQDSVILQPEWLRPLGAWFAGEARPGIVGHDEYGTPYGRWLAVGGDESAVITSTHTTALLDCLIPYGHARVRVGVRHRASVLAVMLSPEARAEVAAYLRRIDATSWTARTA